MTFDFECRLGTGEIVSFEEAIDIIVNNKGRVIITTLWKEPSHKIATFKVVNKRWCRLR
jgi:hypothetical protein